MNMSYLFTQFPSFVYLLLYILLGFNVITSIIWVATLFETHPKSVQDVRNSAMEFTLLVGSLFTVFAIISVLSMWPDMGPK